VTALEFRDATEPRGAASPACPRCGGPLSPQAVSTVLWQSGSPAIVEDVPAHACPSCMEQFYDEAVSDALRRLAENPFDRSAAERIIAVPVFSLRGRIRAAVAMPDDVYLD
jgi:YgiT-type zinc finger domain-containing protein